MVTPLTLAGLDTSTKEPSFSVGLQGLRREDVGTVEKLVLDTLEKVLLICTYFKNGSILVILCQ